MSTYPISATVTFKKGCTAVPLNLQVLVDGEVADLSAYNLVQFIMVLPVDGGADVPKVNAAATFVDKPTGLVRYTWAAANVDTAGDYAAEFRFTKATGEVLRVPTDSAILVRIVEDVEP